MWVGGIHQCEEAEAPWLASQIVRYKRRTVGKSDPENALPLIWPTYHFQAGSLGFKGPIGTKVRLQTRERRRRR